jgi:hypothetical protein
VAAEPRGVAERCTNCGAAATGVYCARCGQRIEPHIHTVWGFTREATESLTHADSRLWRTLLTLLLKPGQLTREFLDGRRASYLPPFRLYLVLSLLFFVVASLLGEGDVVQLDRQTSADERVGVAETKDDRKSCEGLKYGGPWEDRLQPSFKRACEQAVADGGRALWREFMTNVPRMLVLFLPLIAFVMMLMYWLPRRYYVEHLLFFVHNHSFTFLLFLLLMLVTRPLPEGLGGLLTFAALVYAAWYLFRAMRVVYGQGRILTLAKYLTLAVAYLAMLSTLTVLTVFYSALTA